MSEPPPASTPPDRGRDWCRRVEDRLDGHEHRLQDCEARLRQTEERMDRIDAILLALQGIDAKLDRIIERVGCP